jgi:hypothetical protein
MSTLDNPEFQAARASKWPIAFRWGLIIGLASVALQLFWINMGWMSFSSNFEVGNLVLTPVTWAITIALMVKGIRQYHDEHQEGYATFGQAFGTAMLMVVVMSIVIALFFALYMGDVMSAAMNEAIVQQFEESGMDDEEMEQAMAMTKMFSGPVFLTITGFIGSMFSGLLMALLAALLAKREPPLGY